VRILWTDTALNQLEAIRDYLSQTSPAYARRVVERMVPEYEIDEVRQVTESSYRLIYLIKEEQVEILSVIHTSRKGLPQEE
jgi:toxin ParE1/3/4